MTPAESAEIVDRFGAAEVVERLREYVSEQRQGRIEAVLAARLAGIEVAVEEPYDPHNAAAIVRTAEAFGIAAVHVIGAHARVLRARRTTTGAHRWIELADHRDIPRFREQVRGRGFSIAAAVAGGSRRIEDLDPGRPTCLLLGNEHRGLSPAALAAADLQYTIPTFGFSQSLNLSVSAAISLHSLTSRRRAVLGAPGDLSAEARARARASMYLSSVDERLARGLFPARSAAGSRLPR